MGLPNKSKLVIKEEDPAIIKCLQDFTDGVNFYILSAGRKLPLEFRILSYKPELWTLEDIASIIGIVGWSLTSHNLDIELFSSKVIQKLGTEITSGLIPGQIKSENVVYPGFQI